MALPIVRLPKTSTHCAPQLHAQRGSKEVASLRGKMRFPLATAKCRPPLRIHCSIPTNGGNAAALNEQGEDVEPSVFFGRSSFPHGFLFGAASSSYQTEGGVDERGGNIWDTFCRDFPDKIADKSNGDVAIDSYHRYMEDVALLKAMGLDAYRFSISWPRILRDGTLKGGVNDIGVKYYNKLIDTLLDNGIKPFVTLFHWDVPQALEDEYGGFRDRKIVTDFKDYCEVCYKAFGDRVKHWITLNEPYTFSTMGYGLGLSAPGRCSSNIPEYNYINCPAGDSKTEPYIVAHNLILAHASAARLYKEKYQATQNGKIGITLNSMWHAPYNNEYDDLQAQGRALDFNIGWFMDPLVNGDYPFNMRALVRDRLPYFEDKESKMIKGSFDFLGLNYYTGTYEKSRRILKSDKPNLYVLDSYAEATEIKDGVPIGDETGTWIYVYPKGMRDLLMYIKSRYHNPPIYITENGMCEVENPKLPLEKALDDPYRKHYISLHLNAVKEAIRAKVDVQGYFHWSLTDNFEWREGYTQRYGLNYIDYKDNLKRIPKTSATWFTNFLKS